VGSDCVDGADWTGGAGKGWSTVLYVFLLSLFFLRETRLTSHAELRRTFRSVVVLDEHDLPIRASYSPSVPSFLLSSVPSVLTLLRCLDYLWVFISAGLDLLLYAIMAVKIIRQRKAAGHGQGNDQVQSGAAGVARVMMVYPMVYILTMCISLPSRPSSGGGKKEC
jgi:hypothetical protein